MANIYDTFSQQELDEFRQNGYSDMDIQQVLNEVEREQQSPLQQSYNQAMAQQRNDPRRFASNSMFGAVNQDNLIKWQLDMDSILERIEHMLRGDRISFQDGNIFWIRSEKDEDKIFNEFGVSEIMRILSMYLNRNTILSNYTDEVINYKVYDMGMEVADLIYLKYESMGLNTLEKRKLYPIVVREIVDSVHSAYLRAYQGGERRSLREARSVTQNEQMAGAGININTGQIPIRSRGMLNPMRYIKGKNY